MTRTLTAMFDSRAEAEAAQARLQQGAALGASDVHIFDQSSSGHAQSSYSTHEDRGFWDNLKSAFLPDEDRHTYEEGVRRGHCVLTVTVPEDRADETVRLLEEANAVDLEDRSSSWRQGGWNTGAQTGAATTSGEAAAAGSGSAFAFGGSDRTSDHLAETGGIEGERRIPIVEEELRVGKREVSRGGVRVRSYVVETPVSEQVTLRDEHVSVEHRVVDRPITSEEDAFREREIEMTETAEEAIVAKDACVREELVVRKDVDQHVETVQDSVRHTQVDVDQLGDERRGTTDRDDLTRRDDRF